MKELVREWRAVAACAWVAAALAAPGCCGARAPVALESRVIDVHAHTFNAHYLPVREIALGKRDKLSKDELPPDWVAEAVARYILWRTPWPGGEPAAATLLPSRSALQAAADGSGHAEEELREQPMIDALVRLDEEAAGEAAREAAPDEGAAGEEAEHLMAETRTERQRQGVRQLAGLFGTAAGFARAYRSLTARDDRQVARYAEQSSGGAGGSGVALVVSQMMDLGPVYDQAAEAGTLLDFRSQIERMDELQRQQAANTDGPALIYFVAYNPFRDHWNGGTDGTALKLVTDAIDEHGAYGVKVYPPSGYRPAANRIPPRPESPREAPPRQWDARYGRLHGDASLLDRRLDALLRYCEARGVPILVHCNTGEFEARAGYGRAMSDPKYWKRWLEARSAELGRPSPLRLCFGHAGGSAFWFGEEPFPGAAAWGELVSELCTAYPNVYCEIGVHDQITDEGQRAKFVANLARLFGDSAGAPIRFGDKLMYGTDWFMPLDVELSTYLRAYHRAFRTPELKPWYERFFFRNALAFLDVERRRTDGRLPPGVRSRLDRLTRPE